VSEVIGTLARQQAAPDDELTRLLTDIRVHNADTVAFATPGGKISYGELFARIDALAAALLDCGVRPGHLVATADIEGVPAVVAFMAILHIGAGHLPLNPFVPRKRNQTALGIARPALLLEGSNTLAPGVPAMRLDRAGLSEPAASPTEDITHAATYADVAYVMPTSGSTGEPKLALITRSALAYYVQDVVATFPWPERRVALQMTPLSADGSVREILADLAIGATLVPLSINAARDPEAVLKEICRNQVTILMRTVPRQLAGMLQVENCKRMCRSVATTLVCGESLLPLIQSRSDLSVFGTLFNQYGVTECTVTSTWCRVSAEAFNGDDLIGVPLPHARAYIVDADRCELPPLTPGELAIGGDCVGAGYLGGRGGNVFRDIRLRDSSVERVYLTGDHAMLREDGALVFLGRLDRVASIQAHRVSLPFVESRLAACRGVDGAAVVVCGGGRFREHLEAFVITDGIFDQNLVVNDLREILSSAEMPFAFHQLRTFPLLSSGKIDYAALTQYATSMCSSHNGAAGLHGSESLPDYLCRRLGRDAREDSRLAELGLTSLIAVEVATEWRRARGQRVPLRLLLQGTMAEVRAFAADVTLKGPAAPEIAPAAAHAQEAPVPMTVSERLVWASQLMSDDPTDQRIFWRMRIDGQVDLGAFRKALLRLRDRHERLRSCFEFDGRIETRSVKPGHECPPFIEFDAPLLAPEDCAAAMPLDARAGLNLRVHVHVEAPDLCWIDMHLDHLAADTAGVEALLRDLGGQYLAEVTGMRTEPLRTDYGPYSCGPAASKCDSGRTLGATVELLARVRASSGLDHQGDFNCHRAARVLNSDAVAALRHSGMALAGSPTSTLLTCGAVLTSEVFSMREVALGVAISMEDDTADRVRCAARVAIIPAFDLDNMVNVSTLGSALGHYFAEALDGQGLLVGDVVSVDGVPCAIGTAGLAAIIDHEVSPYSAAWLPNATVRVPYVRPPRRAPVPIAIRVVQAGSSYQLELIGQAMRFNAAEVDSMAQAMETLLTSLPVGVHRDPAGLRISDLASIVRSAL
jgi:acyl-CoA synthetase (AMP-forming)/AMP-acid ligase II